MIALAVDGITSLSVKPLQFITGFGIIVALISFIGCLWALITALCGKAVAGWASMTCIVCFVSGVQLICLGIIGEYIGENIHGDQAPSALYNQRAYLEKIGRIKNGRAANTLRHA